MRRLILPVLAALMLGAVAVPATAAETPRPGPLDPRIRTILYDADQVVRLTGYFGFQMMLEFGEDERIENVSIGDALSWQVTPNKKATVLFIKPIDRAGATNMTVVTDRRRYAFDLAMAAPKTGQRDMAYVVRFEYPPEPFVLVETPKPQIPPPLETLNIAYAVQGAPSVSPLRVFDDGSSTWFDFPADSTLPAIFVVGPDGRETLANFTMRERYVVVDQKAARFILRDGDATAMVADARATPPPPPTAAEKKGRGPWRTLGWLPHGKNNAEGPAAGVSK